MIATVPMTLIVWGVLALVGLAAFLLNHNDRPPPTPRF